MAADVGFTWDATWSTNSVDAPVFPFTLEKKQDIVCSVPPCPKRVHAGQHNYFIHNYVFHYCDFIECSIFVVKRKICVWL